MMQARYPLSDSTLEVEGSDYQAFVRLWVVLHLNDLDE